jgi:YaiO family outer membrane protein
MKRRLLAAAAAILASAAPPPAPVPTPAPAATAAAAGPYEEAVAARHAGDHARAAAILRGIVAAEPDHADAHLQLGLALIGTGELDAAEASLRRTLDLAPQYDDARIALARIARRRGDDRAATAALDPVGPANSEAAGLRAQIRDAAGGGARWQLDLDGSYSMLDTQPDWREGSTRIRYQASPATAVGAVVETARRFGVSDTYGELRVDQRLGDGASAYATVGGTPDADFRPKWQIGAGASARLAAGANPTVATIDARQARYRSGDIQTLTPGIEQYLADGRVWLTARWINIFDEDGDHEAGWLARGDVLAGKGVRLFAGVADAPDVSEGVVLDTFSLFGGISVDVNRSTTFRISVAHEDRARGADRMQVGIGLGLRF